MSYQACDRAGESCERRAALMLEEAGVPARLARDDPSASRAFLDWDVSARLGRRDFTMECKNDLLADRTGNVAIEWFNTKKGRPSGLSATRSDLWSVFFASGEAHVCRTCELKRFTSDVKPSRTTFGSGDDNAALWLYPKEVILPAVFRPMTGLSPAQLRALLAELLEVS